MSQVATALNDGPEGSTPTKLVQFNSLERLVTQVNTLLAVVDKTHDLLQTGHDVGASVETDPQAKEECRKTHELAHLRLRDILDDQQRWGAQDPQHDRLVQRLIESNLKVHEEQRRSVAEARRPSALLRATCRVASLMLDGQRAVRWVAFLGAQPTNDGLVGIGASPDEAMRNLDARYLEKLELAQALEQESPPEPPAPPAMPKPRKKKNRI